MTADDVHAHSEAMSSPLTTAELIDRLGRFQGPPQEFLVNLLAVQCHVGSAAAGAILRADAEGRLDVLAVWPPRAGGATAPSWLAHAAESAAGVLGGGTTAIRALHDAEDMYGQPARRNMILIPLPGRQQGLQGLAAFVIDADGPAIGAAREKLELTVSLLGLYEMRLTLQRRTADMQRLRSAMELLAAVNSQSRFRALAMAFCNELASRYQCERVGVGFLKGRYVKLAALSHTEKFSRKMKIVQDIEATMEECLDQDVEIVHPAPPTATFVNRCAGDLSKRHGPTCVLSLPLRRGEECHAVVTLERPVDVPFTTDEAEALRLTSDMCTTRLSDLHEKDRWFGARMARGLRKGGAFILGAKHTWIKLLAIGVLAFAAFLVFVPGDYEADGTFVLEAVDRQVLPAPYTGQLKAIHAEPGQEVIAGETILAELDTADPRLELLGLQKEKLSYEKQEDAARRDGKTAEARIYAIQAQAIQAKIDLWQHKIDQATIRSPIDGIVISGDLKRRIGVGGPVELGDVLFEVAPLEALRADLFVPEDQIAEVKEGQEGELAAASFPGQRVKFVVESIHPVAEVIEQKNVFKVRLKLQETRDWMQPGMEGVGRIHLGRKPYGELWTRRLVNWLRMRLWL